MNTQRGFLSGFERSLISSACLRNGLSAEHYVIESIDNYTGDYKVAITMGNNALERLTGKKSVDKWQLSPLDNKYIHLPCKRVIPTFDFGRMHKQGELKVYFEMAVKRAVSHAEELPWLRKPINYILNPKLDEAIYHLEGLITADLPWLSLDIETGYNQINTFGVAWSRSDALAVSVLPSQYSPAAFYKLWSLIGKLCECDKPKIMQNGIYERMFLSRYGIHINNFTHDTMVAQKFLWPELAKGLDNVGRIYTMEPYWKDMAVTETKKGGKKDWGNIKDWNLHAKYNACDTSNTYIAALAQRYDLRKREMLDLYDNYIVSLFDPIYEMCTRGLPLNTTAQARIIAEYQIEIDNAIASLSSNIVKGKKQISAITRTQKIKLLEGKLYTLPLNKKTKSKSVDELSLRKLQVNYPNDTDIDNIITITKREKAISSYLTVKTLDDNRIRYMIDPHGTETGRFSCSRDPWRTGFNAQTIPSYTKKMIEWDDSTNRIFLEVDLRQAETRFVAYDAREAALIKMLENDEDIHSYVAAEIYQKSINEITKEERQLGKKAGHGANYDMGVNTFRDTCLKDMKLALDKKTAYRILESYHKLFPEINRWQSHIRKLVYTQKYMTTPIGRVRYFYGRMDDSTYREAYAYRPQSTIPDITNHLLLALCSQRNKGIMSFWLHCQVHDSLVLSCHPGELDAILKFMLKYENWHPVIKLAAGDLIIPIEIKTGKCLGTLTKFIASKEIHGGKDSAGK